MVDGFTARVPARVLARLANLPCINYITLDRPVRMNMDYTAAAIDLKEAHVDHNLSGHGVGVAVIDSGIAHNWDLNGRIAGFRDLVKGRYAPYDDNGHGTHVAGIIAGTGALSNGKYKGVAPGAHIYSIKVLDAEGKGMSSNVIKAIDMAIYYRNYFNIRVINLSLSGPILESYRLDPMCQAVERAWKAGIVVVCAAGNLGTYGYGTVGSPGNDPFVITVGAMNCKFTYDTSDDVIGSYSSKGLTRFDCILKPDLVAPGNKVASIRVPGSYLDSQFPENRVGMHYFRLSGTSMAVPAVAGAAAVLFEKDPWISPDTVK
ncbi:MAG TPA: S8 family peptidase, partial [Armatimonadota bacterium]|nr:S8 family peptidase [Armatimonadota bacterium]